MNIVDIINKKRENNELTKEELDFAFNGYLHETVKDYQMSALLMAICINGMSERETFDLVDIFIKSGDILDLSFLKGIKVDKHSTGGIGDKITLIVGPIVHHKEMVTQFENKENKKINYENIIKGIFLFTLGVAKKILIADPLTTNAQEFFAGGGYRFSPTSKLVSLNRIYNIILF